MKNRASIWPIIRKCADGLTRLAPAVRWCKLIKRGAALNTAPTMDDEAKKNPLRANRYSAASVSINVVVLTGAGISAESGLGTFRAADGLWEAHRIEDVATPEAFMRNPRFGA